MTLNKLIVPAVLALAPLSLLTASPAALVTAAPCAPVIDPREPTVPRPDPPAGLRILSQALFDRLGLDMGLEAASGPRADETLTAAIGDPTAHAYFDALSSRSDCLVAYSLRDADQILEYAQSKYQFQNVTYDPGSDPDPRRQDAAKVLIPAGKVSLPNQVRLPIPSVGGDTLLVTWDVWWGKEFRYEDTHIGDYKAFQFASPAGRIWTEIQSDFNAAVKRPPAVAMAEVRAYGEIKNGELGPNVTNEHPLSPMLNQFGIQPETWTRYWVFFKPAGEWHEFSFWMADENRDPILINDRLQMKPGENADGWEKFWLEYNTSSHPQEGLGERVSYVRNVVMLRGVADPKALLERPRP